MEALYIMYGTIAWLACGIVGYGLTYAFFKRNWPMLDEPRFNDAWLILFGPCAIAGLVPTLIRCNGWRKAFKYGFLI